QVAQRMRDPYLFARRRQTDADTPVQPFRTARVAPLRPTEALVELAHEQEHSIVDRGEVTRESLDSLVQIVDRRGNLGALWIGLSAHRGPPSSLNLLITSG